MLAIPDSSSGSRLLRTTLPIVDTTSTPLVALAPGTPLCGEIDIATRFPELGQTLRTEGVWVLWAYSASVDRGALERYAGGLYIPRVAP
jgi:hypothetical protein